jgi:hypothetical protein
VADYVYFYYRIIIIINISGILWKILQKSMIWFLRKKYKIPLSPYILQTSGRQTFKSVHKVISSDGTLVGKLVKKLGQKHRPKTVAAKAKPRF